MNLPLFIESAHCTTRRKCHICQSGAPHGEQFRSALGVVFEMPGPGRFACPFGVDPATVKPVQVVDTRPKEIQELEKMVETGRNDPLLGDRIEAWAKSIGADKAAKLWEEWTGIPCGCPWRKAMLNKLDGTWREVKARLWGGAQGT